jgi:hypothetical protein
VVKLLAGENRDAPISTVIVSRVGSDEQAIEGLPGVREIENVRPHRGPTARQPRGTARLLCSRDHDQWHCIAE